MSEKKRWYVSLEMEWQDVEVRAVNEEEAIEEAKRITRMYMSPSFEAAKAELATDDVEEPMP